MTTVSDDIIKAAIEILGTPEITEEEIVRQVRALVEDDMTATRLIDWIPEAFARVWVAHLPFRIDPGTSFSARTRSGKWLSFPVTVEPIFNATLLIAQSMFHQGPRATFEKVGSRSSTISSINNGLNAGSNLNGAVMSGPALLGIPAEIYPEPPKSFWRRLFSR